MTRAASIALDGSIVGLDCFWNSPAIRERDPKVPVQVSPVAACLDRPLESISRSRRIEIPLEAYVTQDLPRIGKTGLALQRAFAGFPNSIPQPRLQRREPRIASERLGEGRRFGKRSPDTDGRLAVGRPTL